MNELDEIKVGPAKLKSTLLTLYCIQTHKPNIKNRIVFFSSLLICLLESSLFGKSGLGRPKPDNQTSKRTLKNNPFT